MTSKLQGSPSRSVHHNNLMNKAGSIKQLKASIGIPVSAQPQMQQQQKQVLLQQALYSMKNKDVANNDSFHTGKQIPTTLRQGPPPGLPIPASIPSTPPPIPKPVASLEKKSPLDLFIARNFDGDNSGASNITVEEKKGAQLKSLLQLGSQHDKKSNSPTSVSNSTASAPVQEKGAQLKNMLKVGTQQKQQQQREEQQEEQKQESESAASTKNRSSSLGEKKTNSSGKDGNRGDKERSSSMGDTKKEKANNKKGKEGAKQASKEGSKNSAPAVNFATSKFMASPDPNLMPMPDFDDSFLKDDD